LARADTQVTEGVNQGTDTVQVNFGSYTLPDNVERLVYAGTGNFAGTGNTLNNVITGGPGKDLLRGGAGNDTLTGGSGNDKLSGGAGADTLTGGLGADKFVFSSTSDFPTGSLHDTITDFSHAQGDQIDLSALDANTKVAGNQAFTYLGTAAFTHHAGELRAYYDATNDQTIVSGDWNGDGVADFNIYVQHVHSLLGTDFVL
jgi:Ca2+-binding RTX toxin-like protein